MVKLQNASLWASAFVDEVFNTDNGERHKIILTQN